MECVERSELRRAARGLFTGLIRAVEGEDRWTEIRSWSEFATGISLSTPTESLRRAAHVTYASLESSVPLEVFMNRSQGCCSGSLLMVATRANLNEDLFRKLYLQAVTEVVFGLEIPLLPEHASEEVCASACLAFVQSFALVTLPIEIESSLRQRIRLSTSCVSALDVVERMLPFDDFQKVSTLFIRAFAHPMVHVEFAQAYRYFASYLVSVVDRVD